jgi:hypothetical protein
LRAWIAPSDGFEFQAFADELDRFGQGRNTEAEGALDNAGFAADVARDVEGSRLPFSERAHHLEALDRGVGRPQRLEAPDRPDQLL